MTLRLLPPLLLCFACHAQSIPPVVVAMAPASDTVTVSAGHPFVIALPSHIGAGYAWQLRDDDNPHLQVDSVSTFPGRNPENTPPTLNDPDKRDAFHLRIMKAGVYALPFDLSRSWESGSPLDSTLVTVTVLQ